MGFSRDRIHAVYDMRQILRKLDLGLVVSGWYSVDGVIHYKQQ